MKCGWVITLSLFYHLHFCLFNMNKSYIINYKKVGFQLDFFDLIDIQSLNGSSLEKLKIHEEKILKISILLQKIEAVSLLYDYTKLVL